jgi:GTP-binding protein
VVFFVLDASAEITVQDQAIATDILDAGKAVIILLNKIDKLDKLEQQQILDKLPDYLPQMWYVPVIFSSAQAFTGMDLLLKFAVEALGASDRQIEQPHLDEFLQKIMAENMPGKIEDERTPKIFGLAQVGVRPPVFKMTVNFSSAIAPAWKKWFEKQFRLKFGFEGTPIIIRYVRKV